VIAKHEEQSDLGLGIVLNLIMCKITPSDFIVSGFLERCDAITIQILDPAMYLS
jgi:hypothetical protein